MTRDKILFLGPEESPLYDWLQTQEDDIVQESNRINVPFIEKEKFTFLVSYGYRHILKKQILDRFPNRAINLHISYLPWNRGADPNFWSFVDGTLKGVTIHYLDEGVDTGDIIFQKETEFVFENETLATTYAKLQLELQTLFKSNWGNIKSGTCPRIKQQNGGSSHVLADKKSLAHLLVNDWDTPVSRLDIHFSKPKST